MYDESVRDRPRASTNKGALTHFDLYLRSFLHAMYILPIFLLAILLVWVLRQRLRFRLRSAMWVYQRPQSDLWNWMLG